MLSTASYKCSKLADCEETEWATDFESCLCPVLKRSVEKIVEIVREVLRECAYAILL